MPAIHIARLKKQAALLATQADQPQVFTRSLHHLLDFYADRTQRAGQSGEPAPLLPAYRVPAPVVRQIQQELIPVVENQADLALALCDVLWAENYLEFRMIAISILGQVRPELPERILEHLSSWNIEQAGNKIRDLLITQGMKRLRNEALPAFLSQVERWLDQESIETQQLGLRALQSLVTDPDFENIPFVFRLLGPLSRQASSKIRPELLDTLNALVLRTPREVAYFYHQALEMPNNPTTAWLIRHTLPAFPDDIQRSLRHALRAAN